MAQSDLGEAPTWGWGAPFALFFEKAGARVFKVLAQPQILGAPGLDSETRESNPADSLTC